MDTRSGLKQRVDAVLEAINAYQAVARELVPIGDLSLLEQSVDTLYYADAITTTPPPLHSNVSPLTYARV